MEDGADDSAWPPPVPPALSDERCAPLLEMGVVRMAALKLVE